MRWPAPHWLVLLTFAGGCRGPDHLEHIELTFDSAGRLHLLAHRISGEDEGGDFFRYGFRHAVRAGADAWTVDTIDVVPFAHHLNEAVYDLHPSREGGVVMVINEGAGFAVLDRAADGGPWTRRDLRGLGPYGETEITASWVGEDGELRMVGRDVIIEAVDGELSRTSPTDTECWLDPLYVDLDDNECHFDPTPGGYGEAAVFHFVGGHAISRQRLVCDAGCRWEPIEPSGFGVPDNLGGSSWTDRMFLHSGGGSATVVHRAGLRLRVASGGGSRTVGTDVDGFGAAPRPSGGLVIVTHAYYTDEIVLYVVPEATDLPVWTLSLANIEVWGSRRLAVSVTDGPTERAHVVLPTSASDLVYLSIDVASGEWEREDIHL